MPMIHPIPLALYIHMPWCVRKCPYCDFNSHALRGDLQTDVYIDALLADLAQDLSLVEGREISSIFFGGGTPSLFAADSLARLLTNIGQRVPLVADIEITLEVNPGTVERGRLQTYRDIGINRLSIGVQSMQDDKLALLGRIHSAQEAYNTITEAHEAGFANFNVDLMHGLPQQTVADGLSDLQQVMDLTVPHISWYQLTLEPNTLFAKYPPTLPAEDVCWQLQQQGQQLLQAKQYQHYEVSAYSLAEHACRHNLNYWQFGDYLGIGAGAHSKITSFADHGGQKVLRLAKVKHPKQYLDTAQAFIARRQVVTPSALPFEFMLNALRLQRPVALAWFYTRTGLTWETIAAPLAEGKARGLLYWDDTFIYLSEHGQRYLNDVQMLFLRTN